MKLLVLGNSHVAMLMLADRNAPSDDLDLTFFAKPSGGPEGAVIENGILTATTDDLRDRLDATGTPHALRLDEFDAAVFVGETISAFSAVAMLRRHLVSGWPSAVEAVAEQAGQVGQPMKRALISPAAYRAALIGANAEKLTHRMARSLRAQSPLPIIVVPQPHPSERVLTLRKKYPVFHRLKRAGECAAVAQTLDAALSDGFATFDRIALIAQPGDTVTDDLFTKETLARDAMRLSLQQSVPADDVLHAGPEYGRLILDRVVAAARAMA